MIWHLMRSFAISALFVSGIVPAFPQVEDAQIISVSRASLPADEQKDTDFKIYKGDFNDDGKLDAVVFAYYAFPGGNATAITIHVLENTGNGYKIVARPKDQGDDPRNFRFGQGRVAFDLTVARPNDPRCCPSGKRTVSVRIASSSASAVAVSDPLANKWCDFPSSIERKNGILSIDLGGDYMTFRNVRFDGCKNQICRYSQKEGNRWTVRLAGDTIHVRGPIIAGDGFETVNLTFKKSCN